MLAGRDHQIRVRLRISLATIFHVRMVEEALFPTDPRHPDHLLRFMRYAELILESIPLAVLSALLLVRDPFSMPFDQCAFCFRATIFDSFVPSAFTEPQNTTHPP